MSILTDPGKEECFFFRSLLLLEHLDPKIKENIAFSLPYLRLSFPLLLQPRSLSTHKQKKAA